MNPIDVMGEGVTAKLVGLALDAAVARHAAIAANIANVDTEGYRPLTARFDQLVEELRGRVTDRAKDGTTEQLVQSMRQSLDDSPTVEDTTASKLDLAMQMAGWPKTLFSSQPTLPPQSQSLSLSPPSFPPC